MEDIIKTKFENDDLKKHMDLFKNSFNRIKLMKQNEDSVLTFEDGFNHAMSMIETSIHTFLTHTNDQ